MLVWKEYETLTNIKIEWELASDENIAERRNIIMASGDLPDAFHTALFGSGDIVRYANEGLFPRVDGLIEKYALNLNNLIQDPIVKAGLSLEDGGLYSFRWIDYFYGDEGCELFFMGKEGETFEITEDGEYEFLDIIKNNPDGLNLDQAVGQFTSQPGGGYPGILTNKYFKGAEGRPESIEGAEILQPYFPEEKWPANLYTTAQRDIMSSIGNDIDTYITESLEKFIRGDMQFSEWDDYVSQFDKMGLDEYMRVYKEATQKYFE